MEMIQEKIILSNLIRNKNIFEKAFPFIKDEFFENSWAKIIFKIIHSYYTKYLSIPKEDALRLKITKINKISAELFKQCVEFLDYLSTADELDYDFIISELEEWIKKRSYYLTILNAAEEFENGNLDSGISEKITQALSFNFNSDIGLEFQDENRYDILHNDEEKIKMPLQWINDITNGGIPKKTLNLFMSSSSGGGKTACMCYLAGELFKKGYNCLYITAEISSSRILQRIDANLIDISLNKIDEISKNDFNEKISLISQKTQGRLFVQEYPTATAHCGNVRYLLRELQLKKNFKPDIIFIDYINIFTSFRHPKGENSYTTIKSVCEEFRGLMVETNCIGISATQGNRSAIDDTDLNQKSVSESVGVNYTADMIIGIISTPEFDQQGVYMFKQIKNRYGDTSYKNKILIGVDKPKMRLFMTGNENITVQNNSSAISIKKRKQISVES